MLRGLVARGWVITLGLSALAVVAATITANALPSLDQMTAEGERDPCFRYGRFECCLRE